jgi:hypothetical protein
MTLGAFPKCFMKGLAFRLEQRTGQMPFAEHSTSSNPAGTVTL